MCATRSINDKALLPWTSSEPKYGGHKQASRQVRESQNSRGPFQNLDHNPREKNPKRHQAHRLTISPASGAHSGYDPPWQRDLGYVTDPPEPHSLILSAKSGWSPGLLPPHGMCMYLNADSCPSLSPAGEDETRQNNCAFKNLLGKWTMR